MKFTKKGQVEDWTGFVIAILFIVFILIVVGVYDWHHKTEIKRSVKLFNTHVELDDELLNILRTNVEFEYGLDSEFVQKLVDKREIKFKGSFADLIKLGYYDDAYLVLLKEELNKLLKDYHSEAESYQIMIKYYGENGEKQTKVTNVVNFDVSTVFRLPMKNGYVDVEYYSQPPKIVMWGGKRTLPLGVV